MTDFERDVLQRLTRIEEQVSQLREARARWRTLGLVVLPVVLSVAIGLIMPGLTR
ncbi:hypothetical protein [Phytohabitans rumicis]|uniref:hypothetical protein n=1 Tax=Phytohabitans rumicis TaxID=1076125 RepID=UPI0015632C2E|nr:hypothetical protein [Phytohabitans rumicis]